MKNTLLFLFLAGSLSSYAQMEAGLKAGANYAGFSGHDGGKIINAHGGVFIHSTLNNKWHIQPELIYSGEGQRYTTTDGEQEFERTVTISTVAIPVMFQYITTSKIYFEAGPQFSIILSAKEKGTETEKQNLKRSFANTPIALNAGMGLAINRQIHFYARYSFGLTDLTRYNDQADHSRVIQAGFSYRFAKKAGTKALSQNR